MASEQARAAASRATAALRLAKAGILFTFERRGDFSGEVGVTKYAGRGGLALIEVLITIVLLGMLCAVVVAALTTS